MAFRGDIQGGQAAWGAGSSGGGGGMGGAGMGGMAGMGLVGGQAIAGIEKTMQWKVLFFGGAVMTFASGIGCLVYEVSRVEWAPATLISDIFLFLFGGLMVVLDFPIRHPQKWLVNIRDNCYKFLLFMTRFMGRGVWYLFLSTLVFASLWDNQINWFLGGVFTAYLCCLGIAALVKGYMISSRLQSVREAIVSSGRGAEHYIARGQSGLSKEQFRAMVEQVTNRHDLFTNDDLDYVINALSFTPYNDGQVSMEEAEYWLRPGPILMV
uniref:COPI associated protein n=1 Tax=Pyrodinium bahamense TaxID=73915 RepID=A0A7S0BBR5_9DINO|mmetsp:Transcript_6803/g.18820  ORF Transcript_6803/g.18820 Transcript_6803/m.18820 type:complete len:267 (+) Transcript_6803:119-919(+)